MFSESFVDQWGDGETCFAAALGGVLFSSHVNPDKKVSDGVRGQFWFSGRGTGGKESFPYQLEVKGTVTGAPFPPTVGTSSLITWISGSGTMNTQGMGKGKKGRRNAGSACTSDNVTIGGTLTISSAD